MTHVYRSWKYKGRVIAVPQELDFTRDLHDVRYEMLKNFRNNKEGMDRPLTTLTVQFIVLIQ
jgi:hypothetical protein